MTGPQTGAGRNQKGAQAERDLVHWLKDHRGVDAERVRSGRSLDAGDVVWAGSPYHLDVKHQGRWSVQGWFRELEEETSVAPEPYDPLLVLRRPGIINPGEWLAVLKVEDLL